MTATNPGSPTPTIIPRPDHNVSRAHISRNALKVLYRLNQSGYQAFLVGGGVRDLLLGRRPKDFDIATDAHPEDVRRLFRNCRLIGRRFRLAHVHFGPEVIEVATFRAPSDPAAEESDGDQAPADRLIDDSGRILRDNVYGSIDEDVWRRDFTANALYYNIDDFSIWDYTGGAQDIAERTLRMVGDPPQRYQEDPVRMLRAVRFAAKLDFVIHPQTQDPIREFGHLLADVPPARLLDESIKLLMGGAGLRTLQLLREYDLLRYLFPSTEALYSAHAADFDRRLVELGLANSDRRLAEDKSVTPVFLFCVLLWGAIRDLSLDIVASEAPQETPVLRTDALKDATFEVGMRQQSQVAIPRRFTQSMSDILALQPRFSHLQGRHALRLLDHPRFRAACDFFLLRHEAGEPWIDDDAAAWWGEVIHMTPEQAREHVASSASAGNDGHHEAADSDGAPRRKRRRRRGGRGRRRSASTESTHAQDGDAPRDEGGE
ncbi:MAG: polynucleotide adenylyltransferase PcnB [Pseudomonadota bacterium]